MIDPGSREQLLRELAHWRGAAAALEDLDIVAAPAAWAMMEDYLRFRLRERLRASVAALSLEATRVSAAVEAGADLEQGRRQVLALRTRYFMSESVLSLFGEMIQTRTNPTLGAILRGLDTIATDAMDTVLRPLGIETPLTLVYLQTGPGASVLRAGLPLWDKVGPSPVAAIKITRHNLPQPLSVFHELGHQLSALTGWGKELAEALDSGLSSHSRELAQVWSMFAEEIAADVTAFVFAGWSPTPALAHVVDGTTAEVHRLRLGDMKHPPPFLRVLLNTQLCDQWYGPNGPWRDLAATWRARHAPDRIRGEDTRFASKSEELLSKIATICTDQPFEAFRGQPIHKIIDPRRVSPASLKALSKQAGPTLLSSRYLARHDSLRLLALLTSGSEDESVSLAERTSRLYAWLAQLSPLPLATIAN